MPLSFLTAVRIAVDFNKDFDKDDAVNVTKVRLALFGEPGGPELKRSINGSSWTSWYVAFEEGQQLRHLSVADLTSDPTHHDVVYVVFRDEHVSDVMKGGASGLRVLEYIFFVVTTLARTTKCTQASNCAEKHFFDVLYTIYVPTFETLLRSPLEGFSNEGVREGERVVDFHLLVVEHGMNLDPMSTAVYVSRRTRV